jgi:hypothetical protein
MTKKRILERGGVLSRYALALLGLVAVMGCGTTRPSVKAGRELLVTSFTYPLPSEGLAIPFSEHGVCAGGRVYDSSTVGVLIDKVFADQKPIRPEFVTGAFGNTELFSREGEYLYLERRNPILSLTSKGSPSQAAVFSIPLDNGIVAVAALKIEYRIRCPDGGLSPLMTVVGIREDTMSSAETSVTK